VHSRHRTLDRLEREVFDCVVVGGGITGAGIAREAALRGLSVALVEARDFAAGTSSRSSKLIHGGLRYLALGDVATVRQTALERTRIHRLAPHLAEPRWMLVPTRSRAGLAKMRVGLTTYEKLGSVADADRHHNWGADDLAEGEPALDRERYPFACRYREYLTDDARLVLANLRAAEADGAALLNHAPVERVLREGGRAAAASGVEAVCAESGRRVAVRGRSVINAAGPWVDPVCALEDPAARVRLQLSKGVHVSLPREALPVRNIVILNAGDGRSIFVIPRGRIVYVGTTDTPYAGGYDWWPAVEAEDVDYLLAPLMRAFRVDLVRDDVVAAWAGLRPLIADPGKSGKGTTEISRKDEVWIGPGGMVTIAGGKLTGYRPMARATLERAAAEAGLRAAPPPAEDPPLPGGDFDGDLEALAARLCREGEVDPVTARRLVRLYGTEAEAVVARGATPLGVDAVEGEVAWAVEEEGAVHLEDLVYRRMRSALYDPDPTSLVDACARCMGHALGWDDARRTREGDALRARLAADVAFRSGTRSKQRGRGLPVRREGVA
jgi:glycerol-3-phosphate dehydrogenase